MRTVTYRDNEDRQFDVILSPTKAVKLYRKLYANLQPLGPIKLVALDYGALAVGNNDV
jgi:hypothetical protein